MAFDFELAASQDDGVVVLWADGELDLRNRDLVLNSVLERLDAGHAVILDLSRLTFVDSTGLSAMIRCRKAAQRAGLRFAVRGAQGQVAHVLEMTGLGGPLTNPEM
jgi:anti-sigma B factor antagonist